MHFSQPATELCGWTARNRVVLTQFCWPIPDAHSLSLPSSSSAKERRGQGVLHLDDCVQPPNCHSCPMCPLPPVYRPPCPRPFSGVFICIVILVYYILTSFTDTPFQRAGLKRSLKCNGRHPFVYIRFIYLLVFMIKLIILPSFATCHCDAPFQSGWTQPQTQHSSPRHPVTHQNAVSVS